MIWYFLKTIKEIFTNKKVIISSLCIMVLFFGSVVCFDQTAKIDTEGEKISNAASFGVVDYDGSLYSKMIVEYFRGTESFSKFASLEVGEKEAIHQKFLNGEISAYLVIPKGFSECLMNGSDTKIQAVINASNTVVSVMLSNMLDSYDTYITEVQKNSFALYELFKMEGFDEKALNRANWDTSIDLVTKALSRDDLFEKHEVTSMPHTPIYKYYVWALLSLVILYSSVLSGFSFLKEISLGTFARLRIIGHSLPNVLGAILITNVSIWSLLGCMVTRVVGGMLQCEIPAAGYLYIILCIMLANVVFCFLASLCKERKTYMLICNFGLLIMGVIGGVVFPISVMPYRFLELAKCSPNYWIIYRLIQYSNSDEIINTAGPACWMILCSVVFYVLTILVIDTGFKSRVGGEYEDN